MARMIRGEHSYVPKGSRRIDMKPDVTVYLYEFVRCGHEDCLKSDALARACNGKGVSYYAVTYVGNASKPISHYHFPSDARRDQYILGVIAGRREHFKRVNERRQERANPPAVKVGDIFVSSWGYDQTNIDYYAVTRISPSGKSVDLVEVGKVVVESRRTDDVVAPDLSRRGGVYKNKRIGPNGYVRINQSQSAHPWDGRPRSQTGFGFGH